MTFNTASGKTEVAITYLSGAVRDNALAWRKPGFGVLLTPLMGNRPTDLGVHAHDNGVFTEFLSKGKKPFSLDKFLAHLDKWRAEQHQCLFAVAPDVIGDWQATLERSKPVLPEIRKRGYRAALVAQDGLDQHMDQIPWDDFDVLFLGGGQDPKYVSKHNRIRVRNPRTGKLRWVGEWKLTAGAARLVAEARARGKDVHMGRVNSGKRLRAAQAMGCTSADGTCIAKHFKGPEVAEAEVRGWLDQANPGKQLPRTHCYVCRWKAQAWANTYRVSVDQILGNQKCGHVIARGEGGLFEPYRGEPVQLPARRQLEVAA